MGSGRSALLGLTLLMLTGCDPLETNPAVGVTLGLEGRPRIVVNLCPRSSIEEVRLVRANDAVVGNADDESLWLVRPMNSVSNVAIEYGIVPEGWADSGDPGQLVPEQEFEAVIVADGEAQFVTFVPASLTPDEIQTEGGAMSKGDFEDRSQDAC